MSPITRSISLALLLLCLFLGVVLAMQWWLQRESARLLQDLSVTKHAQLAQAIEMFQRPTEKWDGDFQQNLGRLLGGKIALLPVTQSKIPATMSTDALTFEQELKGGNVIRFTY